jgi:hypothetical protein
VERECGLNDHINLYGFWNETAFFTKSGDLGMLLSVPGVDYESLDRSQQESRSAGSTFSTSDVIPSQKAAFRKLSRLVGLDWHRITATAVESQGRRDKLPRSETSVCGQRKPQCSDRAVSTVCGGKAAVGFWAT